MTKRATAGLAGVLLLAGVLAGCGGDDDGDGGGGDGGGDFADQSYADIKQDALDAMTSLEALHVQASVESEGQTSGLDISMSSEGSCTGNVQFGAASAEILRTSDGAWYKPSAELLAQAFPDQAEEVVAHVGDSWVLDTDDEVTGSNCDLESFIDQLSDDEEETDTEVVGVEELDGEDVVRLDYTNVDGDGSAYVLVEGEHYIVKIENKGEAPGTATFSAFDDEVVVEAPADDEVVDLAPFES